MFLKKHANFDTSPRPEMNCKCQSGFQQRNAWKRETPQETKETQTTERRLWEQPLDRLEIPPKNYLIKYARCPHMVLKIHVEFYLILQHDLEKRYQNLWQECAPVMVKLETFGHSSGKQANSRIIPNFLWTNTNALDDIIIAFPKQRGH